jgi:hypothetical protein
MCGSGDHHENAPAVNRGAGRDADRLEERIRVGQFDDSGDRHGRGGKRNSMEDHRVAQAHMQVGGGLLRHQDAMGGA